MKLFVIDGKTIVLQNIAYVENPKETVIHYLGARAGETIEKRYKDRWEFTIVFSEQLKVTYCDNKADCLATHAVLVDMMKGQDR